MLPMAKHPLSIASGRSVEVRTETAGKLKNADSSGNVPLSDTTQMHSAAICYNQKILTADVVLHVDQRQNSAAQCISGISDDMSIKSACHTFVPVYLLHSLTH